jgi:bacterioferritin
MQLLKQNIQGEQCANPVYDMMLLETRKNEPVTYNMALKILQDEVEHEQDI